MESTHITHPVTPMQVAFMGILTPTVNDAKKFMELSASRALEFQKRGWGGYLAITPSQSSLNVVGAADNAQGSARCLLSSWSTQS